MSQVATALSFEFTTCFELENKRSDFKFEVFR